MYTNAPKLLPDHSGTVSLNCRIMGVELAITSPTSYNHYTIEPLTYLFTYLHSRRIIFTRGAAFARRTTTPRTAQHEVGSIISLETLWYRT